MENGAVGSKGLSQITSRFGSTFYRMVKAAGLEYPSHIKRYPWLKLGTTHDLGILVPYFDMLNHSEDSNASYYYDPESDALIVDVIEDEVL